MGALSLSPRYLIFLLGTAWAYVSLFPSFISPTIEDVPPPPSVEHHIPQEPKPWIPVPVAREDWKSYFNWQKQRVLNNSRNNSAELIFIGDSITQLWLLPGDFGKEVWDEYYAATSMNLGIGGDRTEHVLWRLQNLNLSLLVNPSPKVAILCIGTNNIGVANATSSDIAKGVQGIVQTLRELLPHTKVLILGVFPRKHPWLHEQAININFEISRMDPEFQVSTGNDTSNSTNSSMISFLDMGTHFAKSIGEVEPDLYVEDMLHLNTKGYRKWAEVMSKKLDEMLVETVSRIRD